MTVRVGVINLMPRAESYEGVLEQCLPAHLGVELCWIRLENHVYGSSDLERLKKRYWTYPRLVAAKVLDGLIVTGAPVDALEFERVTYWPELQGILRQARRQTLSVLGICWGALALARLLGIAVTNYERKLFGVFRSRTSSNHALTRDLDDEFWCPHSRESGLVTTSLEAAKARGAVRVLADSLEAGPVILATRDDHYVMHLGHPEYPAERLGEEYERDRAAGRAPEAPRNYDLSKPENNWRANGRLFFAAWLGTMRAAVERKAVRAGV